LGAGVAAARHGRLAAAYAAWSGRLDYRMGRRLAGVDLDKDRSTCRHCVNRAARSYRLDVMGRVWLRDGLFALVAEMFGLDRPRVTR
jgi:hypothetical protein